MTIFVKISLWHFIGFKQENALELYEG